MTADEWLHISVHMQARWPNARLADATLAAWFHDLQDFEGEVVRLAIEAHARDGQLWPPNSGEVRQKIIELSLDAPDWSAVKTYLRPAGKRNTRRTCPLERCDGSTWIFVDPENCDEVKRCDCHTIRTQSKSHPLIEAFIKEVGRDSLTDVWEDRTAEAQARRAWEQFLARRKQTAAYEGLPVERVRQLGAPRPIAEIIKGREEIGGATDTE